MLSLKCVVVLALLQMISGEKLPAFFKTCKKDADISKCVENNANYALPYLIKGVQELNIPPLVNLNIPKIYSPTYFPYNFNFEGVITNVEGVTFNNSAFNSEELVAQAKLIFPKLELLGRYKINGLVSTIPITGKGHASVTLHNVTLEFIWSFAIISQLGVDYFKQVSASLVSYEVSSISYNFENLFDGDKIQEVAANTMLNDHWWILAGNFLPHVPNYLVELVYKVVNLAHDRTTVDDVFSKN